MRYSFIYELNNDDLDISLQQYHPSDTLYILLNVHRSSAAPAFLKAVCRCFDLGEDTGTKRRVIHYYDRNHGHLGDYHIETHQGTIWFHIQANQDRSLKNNYLALRIGYHLLKDQLDTTGIRVPMLGRLVSSLSYRRLLQNRRLLHFCSGKLPALSTIKCQNRYPDEEDLSTSRETRIASWYIELAQRLYRTNAYEHTAENLQKAGKLLRSVVSQDARSSLDPAAVRLLQSIDLHNTHLARHISAPHRRRLIDLLRIKKS